MTVTHLSKAVQDLLSVEALCLAGTETCSLTDCEHPVLCMYLAQVTPLLKDCVDLENLQD